jgi:hypothetical protein
MREIKIRLYKDKKRVDDINLENLVREGNLRGGYCKALVWKWKSFSAFRMLVY